MAAFRGGSLLVGVLLSIFVCPGAGHRVMGRVRAARIVFFLFMAAFLFTAVNTYYVVQDTVVKLQSHEQKNMPKITTLLEEVLKDSGGVVVGLFLLIAIYVVAPIELIIAEIWRALRDEDPPETPPATKSDADSSSSLLSHP
ncbi:MAG: hypothetical protein HQM09_07170 [Candidatus Riflebacteria bacterium]|nr:hypothetical protein [Candidatus Riflebacteria bacterium]